jgi:hypothetical protein
MPWKIEFSVEADRELSKLDPQHAKRILKFLRERVAKLDDPRSIGKARGSANSGDTALAPSALSVKSKTPSCWCCPPHR